MDPRTEGKNYSETEIYGKLIETVYRSNGILELSLTLHSGGMFICALPAEITDADLGAIMCLFKRHVRSHP